MLFEKNSVDAVFEDIKEMEKLGEREHNRKAKSKIELVNKISIEQLSYKYPDTSKYILNDVSFEIKKISRLVLLERLELENQL